MDWLVRTLVRFRFIPWLVVLVGAALLWKVNRRVEFDQSIEGFFPPDHPALLNYQRAKEAFGGDDFVFVAYEDESLWTPDGMDRVHSLAKALRANVEGVARVDSLDNMPLPWRVDAAVETLARSAAARRVLELPRLIRSLATVAKEVHAAADQPEVIDALRTRVCASPLFRNVLVDPTGTTTALAVQLKGPDQIDQKRAVQELRSQADTFGRNNGLARVAVVGPPVLLADGFINLEKDNRSLGLVAMGLMALTMLIAVRSPWWAMLPLVCGGMTWLITATFLNSFDLRLTLSAGPIVAQTVVLCMPAASHLAMHFREALGKQSTADDAARFTLVAVAAPILWCAITAGAGYLALFSSSVKPVYQMGLTMAVCNVVAGLLAFGLAAGAMRPPRFLQWAGSKSPVRSLAAAQVGRLTAWILGHPVLTLALFSLPCLAMGVGTQQLQFESNYIHVYRSTSRVAKDYRFVEQRLGGIGLVELVVPAPKESKEITLDWLNSVQDAALAIKTAHPELISEVLSLADVLLAEQTPPLEPEIPSESDASPVEKRPKSPGLLGGLLGTSKSDAATPDQVLQTKLSFLSTPGFSHFVSNFWDRPTGQTRLLVRIRESADNEHKQRAFDEMLVLGNALGPESKITGLSHLMTQVTRSIMTTQFQSTAWAGAAILIMLIIALRSVPLAVLALLPTVLAVGLVLGAMGWLGIRIDLSTALVASVAMGLSVDDTFHCLLRWKRELNSGRSTDEALRISYAGAGPGVVLSSTAVSLGFLALVFSEFVPTANFGWLVAVATLGGSLGNLVALPALLAVLYCKRVTAALAPS
jgi:predicted RND superfamily exporter protein